MPEIAQVSALILAGARMTGDPLCEAEGVHSKAVIEIAGAPMLFHVMRALACADLHSPIWILGGDEENLGLAAGGIPFRSLPAEGEGPAGSLATALRGPVPLPLLVATADHPLLTPEMILSFVTSAQNSDADICIGLARRDVIEAEYPTTRRTYLPIGDRDLSGCNLFYLRDDKAMHVLEIWREVEQHRKHPWRIARNLGPWFLLRLFFARRRSDAVFSLLSKRLGATVRPVILPFAEAAIDVDSPADLRMVRRIFEKRAVRI